MTLIDDVWARFGGASGPLGNPLQLERDCTYAKGWRIREYQSGVVLSDGGQAHAVHGPIHQRYKLAQLDKWATPRTSELRFPMGDGRINWFAGGEALVWRPGMPAIGVLAEMSATWRRTGSLHGPLGAPQAERKPWKGVHLQEFVGGTIYRTPSTGTHALSDPIRDHWLTMGGPESSLGWPVTGEVRSADGSERRAHFEKGILTYTAATGVTVL